MTWENETGGGIAIFRERVTMAGIGEWRKDFMKVHMQYVNISPQVSACPVVESLEPRRLLSGAVAVSHPLPGTVTGAVFNDLNHNGNLDATDARLPDVKVFLDLNRNGVADANEPSVLTDINGEYKFDGLTPGLYRVGQITPQGLLNLSTSGKFSDVVIRPGQTVYSNFTDVNPTATANISGTIFFDSNGDKIRQACELGLPLWRVYLDLNLNGRFDAGEPAVFTNLQGVYHFTVIATGRYLLRPEDPAGWSTDNYVSVRRTPSLTRSAW